MIAAFRNFKNNRLNLFLNLLGLTLGLAAVILISGYLVFELSFDRFHTHKDHIFRVLNYKEEVQWTEPKAPYILGEYIRQDVSEVQALSRVGYLPYIQVLVDDQLERARTFRTADPDLFNMFSFNFIQGSAESALPDPQSVVITESTARLLFPDGNAYGQTLHFVNQQQSHALTITAIIEDLPLNSSFMAQFIGHIELSLAAYAAEAWSSNARTAWENDFFNMYLMCRNGTDQATLEGKMNSVVEAYKDPSLAHQYSLQKLSRIHLHSSHLVNAGRTGNLNIVYILTAVGLGILVIACFNYIILSIAQSTARTKEIGVRKVFGGTRLAIRRQVLGESVLLSLLSLPLALVLAEICQSRITQLFAVEFPNPFNSLSTLLIILAITIFVGLASGSYIAFYLSRYEPAQVFQNRYTRGRSKYIFQKALITLQIFIFVSLLSTTLVIFRQISLGQKKDLGFNQEHLARAYLGSRQMTYIYDTFKEELLQNEYIKTVSGGMLLPPTNSRMMTTVADRSDPDHKISIEGIVADFDIIETMELHLMEGRSFSRKFATDSQAVIINESAVKAMGFENPLKEYINDSRIIGVINDFHLHSLHQNVGPMQISLCQPKYISELLIRYVPGGFDEALEHTRKVWTKYAGDAYFEMVDFQEAIGFLYRTERRMGQITSLFSMLAMVIASMGLFGLSMFTARQRTHEIAVRKALGARIPDILKMYARDFLVLTIAANVLSIPLVVVIMRNWLENFAIRTSLPPLLFIGTMAVSAGIVILTIMFYSYRLARVNPAETLRYE
jgi:putative ABC transport system permease protein